MTESPLLILNEYLPENYDLNLVINHEKPNFNGVVKFKLVKNSHFSGSNQGFLLSLHASKLIITKASLNDAPLKTLYDKTNQTITLTHDSAAPSGELEVTINFMGQINAINTYKDKTYGLFKTNYSDSVTGKSNNYVLATHTQPMGARLIFPLVDELTWKAPVTLTITTNSSFKVFANEAIDTVTPIDFSQNSVFKFKPTPPIASSVFGFVIGDFDLIETKYQDLALRVVTTKGDSPLGEFALNAIAKILPKMIELFKTPFPLSKIDFISLPFLSDMAMENWGLVTIIQSHLLIDEYASDESKKNLLKLISHELVHQWVGNLITFDNWNQLWLNESFATFLGDYLVHVTYGNEFGLNYELEFNQFTEAFMSNDAFETNSSIQSYMNACEINNSASTSSLFDKFCYERGIIILRMIASIFQFDKPTPEDDVDYSKFLSKLGEFLKERKFSAIKSFEIWNYLNDEVSIDLPSFVHSWINYSNFPIIRVSHNGSKLAIEQHRFIYGSNCELMNLEDTPYHVPLFIKVIDEKSTPKILNILLTDRKCELDIPLDNLIGINYNSLNYSRVIYESSLKQQICQNIINNKVSDLQLISILNDFGKNLGQKYYSSSQDLDFLISIFNSFVDEHWTINYDVLLAGLNYLETINHIFMHYSKVYAKFEKWLNEFVIKLFNRIENFEDSLILPIDAKVGYSSTEYEVKNLVLQIGYHNSIFTAIAVKLFKFFNNNTHKNQYFIPKEVFPSILNLTMYQANIKQYKIVLAWVKNSNISNLSVTNLTSYELQTLAISSLSFVNSVDLINKSLNFIKDNIDSKLIELGLLGFKFKSSPELKLVLWTWYKLNYDKFTLRSLRKGSDWSKQIGITMNNVSKLVLGEIMQYDAKSVKEFIDDKLKSLPQHNLKQLKDEIDQENEENYEIANYLQELEIR